MTSMFGKKYTRGRRRVLLSQNPNSNGTDADETLISSPLAKLIIYIRKRKRVCETGKESENLLVPVCEDGVKEMKRYERRGKGKNIDASTSSCVLNTVIKQYKRREKGKKFAGSSSSCVLNTVIKQYKRREKGGKKVGVSSNSCLLNTVIKQYKRTEKRKKNIAQLKDIENVKIDQNAPDCNIQMESNGTGTITGTNNNLISCDLIEEKNKVEVVPVLNNWSVQDVRERKLLILDINGLLADIRQENNVAKKAEFRINGKPAFKRPFCDDFLKFCFENFKVGVWSSRKKENVNKAVNILLGDYKQNLAFCWDLSRCTKTAFKALENKYKFVVLKELKKIWDKSESDLNFEKGQFTPFNTLLLDDSPYKALLNPPHTAIFPEPYDYADSNDNSLGPGGNLRCFLEKLLMVNDVQSYIRDHPFGQLAISQSHPSWDFYYQIIQEMEQDLSVEDSNCMVKSQIALFES